MRPIEIRPRVFLVPLVLSFLATSAQAQVESQPESAYVKLLSKAPKERLGQIVEIIGKRGSLEDLAVLYDRAATPGSLPTAVQLKALEALTDASLTRELRPKVDLAKLASLIKRGDAETSENLRVAAIRLGGSWKAQLVVPDLLALAGSKDCAAPVRVACFESLASIGDKTAREGIEAFAAESRLPSVRSLAVAALVRFDIDQAAAKAVGALTDDARIEDVAPLVAAFLDRQGGSDKLTAALKAQKPTADGARLALRAVYALGRSDEALVTALSHSAGLEVEPKLPTREEMDALVVEVTTKGNSERGETIFRRAELNCLKCHAISGAAGGVGPELSSLGLSSPVDYVVNSILIPDQAIKEEFQTRQILTDDGRVLQGIVVEEDDKRVVLKDATGDQRIVPVSSIEDSKKGGSLMPKGLASLLTHAEFIDLVRFLSELGKPGPYALRATPTIQRWRVLKTDAADIAEILAAEPDRWVAAYAQVIGVLPLADLLAASGQKVVTIQGEIAVSAAGPITLRFNSTKGLTGWLDDQPLPRGDAPTLEVTEGRHKVTLRVELAAREGTPVRVEVVKPERSSAEFSVVGGR